jgi:hypothetical protein
VSTIGSNLETSLLQATNAQQQAAKQRDRDRAGQTESARSIRDLVDLRVATADSAQAVRRVPGENSEQAEEEDRRRSKRESRAAGRRDRDHDGKPRIDLTA